MARGVRADAWAHGAELRVGTDRRAQSLAHQEPFSSDDAYRALDSAERLLQAISAGEQAADVGRMKHELQRRRYTEEARRVARRQTAQPIEGMPNGNLKRWREVVIPHRDVATGQYQ